MGDSSDNYPGVTKVGEKTAMKLLQEWGSIDNLYENIDSLKKSKMKENLIADREMAFYLVLLQRLIQNLRLKLILLIL